MCFYVALLCPPPSCCALLPMPTVLPQRRCCEAATIPKRCSKPLLTMRKAIEPVAPITDHNARRLPPQEILIQGSEEPPIAQSDILLRAATSGRRRCPNNCCGLPSRSELR